MLDLKLIGVDKLLKKLDKKTIQKPLNEGIKKITLWLERLVKQSTVVDTGTLRARVEHEVKPLYGRVFNLVEYAPFIEHGTVKMEARHMEGSVKILGQGMFSYSLGKLKDVLPAHLKEIGEKIVGQWRF